MKAISIRQPWAWAIIHAGKDIENRNWPTRYRGPVLIHAAKGMTNHEFDSALDFIARAIPSALPLAPRQRMERGGIVGQADIVGCVEQSNSPWFMGRYGFVLRNVRPLAFLPCKGALGFFEPEITPVAESLRFNEPPSTPHKNDETLA